MSKKKTQPVTPPPSLTVEDLEKAMAKAIAPLAQKVNDLEGEVKAIQKVKAPKPQKTEATEKKPKGPGFWGEFVKGLTGEEE